MAAVCSTSKRNYIEIECKQRIFLRSFQFLVGILKRMQNNLSVCVLVLVAYNRYMSYVHPK